MNWLKAKIQHWLGIDSLQKKTTDMWWGLNDGGHGAITKWEDHEKVLDYILKMVADPKNYKWKKDKHGWVLAYKESGKSGYLRVNKTFYTTMNSHTHFKYSHPQAMLEEDKSL